MSWRPGGSSRGGEASERYVAGRRQLRPREDPAPPRPRWQSIGIWIATGVAGALISTGIGTVADWESCGSHQQEIYQSAFELPEYAQSQIDAYGANAAADHLLSPLEHAVCNQMGSEYRSGMEDGLASQ